MDEKYKFDPDAERAYKLCVDTVMPRVGSMTSRDDFGQPPSYGVNLRRKGANHSPASDWIDGVYGIYLGNHGGKWVVGIKDMFWRVIGLAEFDTLPELKELWELD